MTDLIFSFDTEDYIHKDAAEGILQTAQLLRNEGLKGSYQTVGMMAEALLEWGRTDVIEEISRYHEIGFHSHRHSLHPTINEYTDVADYYTAFDEFTEDESLGLKKLRDIFGLTGNIASACPPGDSTSYVAHYAYAKMGFPIYTGDILFDARRNRPVYSCNIASLEYNYSLEKFLFTATEDSMKKYIEEKIVPRDIYVFYNHPQRISLTQYCEVYNFWGKNVPKEKWILSPKHTDEEIATFYKNFKIFISLLKNDPRINIITYAELAEKIKGERNLTKDMLANIKAQLEEYFFPVTIPDSFCIADVFHACADFLKGAAEHKCGEVYGFLDTPYETDTPVTLTADEIKAIAYKICPSRFIPEYYLIDDKKIGAADWLRAALALIVDGVESYTVQPGGAWQIDLDQFPALRDLNYKGCWCHCASLEDRYLSKRFRLQSWTFRLPAGTDRKIF